jgi:hypothetical protein
MSAQVTVTLTNGMVMTGITYTYDTNNQPPPPGAAGSPSSFSFESASGWVTLSMSDIAQIQVQGTRPT